MPQDQTQLFALAVNTLGGGIVGAIAALCLVDTQTAREGFKRTVVSVIVSGCCHVPAIWLIRRYLWTDFPDEFTFTFSVQVLLGLFGFYLFAWPMNELEGTQKMKLSKVMTSLLGTFGPVLAPWFPRFRKEEKQP